jgi:putative tryptophan/tyrosine transport system substrate-binding protein
MLAAGLVRSFSHPGGNITGVSILGADLNGKRLEVLMEAVPSARNIAILADPNNTPPVELTALQNAARGRGVEVAVLTAGMPEQITKRTSCAGALMSVVRRRPEVPFRGRQVRV